MAKNTTSGTTEETPVTNQVAENSTGQPFKTYEQGIEEGKRIAQLNFQEQLDQARAQGAEEAAKQAADEIARLEDEAEVRGESPVKRVKVGNKIYEIVSGNITVKVSDKKIVAGHLPGEFINITPDDIKADPELAEQLLALGNSFLRELKN